MGRFGNVLLVNGEPRWDIARAPRRGGAVLPHQRLEHARLQPVVSGRAHAHEGRRLRPRPLRAGSLGRQRHHRAGRALRRRRALRASRARSRSSIACARSITSWRGSSRRRRRSASCACRAERARRPITRAAFERLRRNADVAADIDRYRPHFDRPVDHELTITLETGDLPFPLRPLMNFESVYRHPVEWSGTMPEMDWVATGTDGAVDPARARDRRARTWTSTGASASATSSSCGWSTTAARCTRCSTRSTFTASGSWWCR